MNAKILLNKDKTNEKCSDLFTDNNCSTKKKEVDSVIHQVLLESINWYLNTCNEIFFTLNNRDNHFVVFSLRKCVLLVVLVLLVVISSLTESHFII